MLKKKSDSWRKVAMILASMTYVLLLSACPRWYIWINQGSTGHHIWSESPEVFQDPYCLATGRFPSRSADFFLFKLKKRKKKCFFGPHYSHVIKQVHDNFQIIQNFFNEFQKKFVGFKLIFEYIAIQTCPANLGVWSCPVLKLICPVLLSLG